MDWKQDEKLERGRRREELKPRLKLLHSNEPVKIALVGDQHIGSKFFNEAAHQATIDRLVNEECHVILMGDAIECSTKDSVGAGVYEQNEILDEQIETFIDLYLPLAKQGKILGIHPGNHEYRLYNTSGLNLTRWMARELGTDYFGFGQLTVISISSSDTKTKSRYRLYTTHGKSGARVNLSKLRAVMGLERVVDADVYAAGHVHLLDKTSRTFYMEDTRNRTMRLEQKHYVLTGSYLSHWSSYAHMANMEPVRNGTPIITFGSHPRSISIEMVEY